MPSLYQCGDLLFDKIRRECAGDVRFDAGSVNVLRLPHWGDDGTGFFEGVGRFFDGVGQVDAVADTYGMG